MLDFISHCLEDFTCTMRFSLLPPYFLLLTTFVFDSGWTKEQERQYFSASGDRDSYGKLTFSPRVQPSSTSLLLPPSSSSNHGGGGGEDVEPRFLTKGQRLTVELGDTIVLPCMVDNQGDATVLWKQGDRVISAGAVKVRKDDRLTLVEAASLRIIMVDVADAGNYTCEIEWGLGKPKQIVHTLEVHVPPHVEAILPGGYGQIDRPVEAREGSSVKLECRADGIPTPTIRWRRRDGILPSGLPSSPKGPVLHIPNVLKEHAGTYICTASNGVGSISADEIELLVYYPPEVTSSDRTVHAWPGGSAQLTCIVRAEPRALVTWYLDGHRVLPDARHLTEEHGALAVLRMRQLSVRELGNYTCQAENNQGRARDHIELSGKPEIASINSAPEGLFRDSYNLTWTVRSKSPLTEVRLLFRRMDQPTNYNNNGSWNNILLRVPTFWYGGTSADAGSASSASASAHSSSSIGEDSNSSDNWSRRRQRHSEYHVQNHLFRDLKPNSRYEVIVQSRNQFGWSEATRSFVFTTRIRDYSSPKSFASYPSFASSATSTSPVEFIIALLLLLPLTTLAK